MFFKCILCGRVWPSGLSVCLVPLDTCEPRVEGSNPDRDRFFFTPITVLSETDVNLGGPPGRGHLSLIYPRTAQRHVAAYCILCVRGQLSRQVKAL